MWPMSWLLSRRPLLSVLASSLCGGVRGRQLGCLWRHSERAKSLSNTPSRRGGFRPAPLFSSYGPVAHLQPFLGGIAAHFQQQMEGGSSMEISDIVALYVECIRIALPFTIVFYLAEFVTSTILRTAFGGKLTFKSF